MAATKKTTTTTTTNKKTTSKVAAKAPAKKGAAKKATPAKAAKKPEKEKKKKPTLKQILIGVGAGAAGLFAIAAYGNHKEEKGYTAGLEAKLDQVTTEQTTVTKTEEEQQND